jgi:hypothetical protein
MGESKNETCSISVYTPVLKLFILLLNLDERLEYCVGSDGFGFEREVLPMDEHWSLLDEVIDSLRLKSVASRIESLLSFESEGFLGLKRKLLPLS